jgi:Na+-transporting methylmalonyl-CoA/oxaloacetate decarboxylase gamma subunit
VDTVVVAAVGGVVKREVEDDVEPKKVKAAVPTTHTAERATAIWEMDQC